MPASLSSKNISLSALVGNEPFKLAVAGYSAGGDEGGDTWVATVDKFAFSSDSRSTLATGLSLARGQSAGFSNAGVAGYTAAGEYSGGNTATVDKFAFPSDSRSVTTSASVAKRSTPASFFNESVAGYTAGGFTSGRITTVEKWTFPTDTNITLPTGIATGVNRLAGFQNVAVAGYAAGGDTGSALLDTVNRFAFSSDSRTTLATGLSDTEFESSGLASQNAGYIAGGQEGPRGGATRSDSMDKFSFPTETRSIVSSVFSTGRAAATGFANTTVAGYVVGGENSSATIISLVEKIDFSTDSASSVATGLSTAKRFTAGMQDA